MNSLFPPPPPPITAAYLGGSSSDAIVVSQPHYSDINNSNADVTGDSSPSPSPSSSIVIVIIVVASAIIVSATIYLLLKFIAKRCRRTFQTFSATSADDNDVIMRSIHNNNANASGAAPCFDERRVTSNSLLDSLPLFTFGSVTGNLTGVECAVCLSKFELQDQLRLLPLCCHAFHARCIDTWLVSNLTCPLCRSSVNPTDSEVLSKILPPNDIRRTSNADGGSFRIEIGSVSRRHGRSDSADSRRSYSIGSFEYIVDDGYEVSVDSTHRRGLSECTSVDKESVGVPIPAPPGESLAGEVTAGRSWLRDYVDRLGSFSFSSRTMSFRSSGRFFAGSSRRSDVVVPIEDLEANRIGEEISELFRWLSGV